MAVFCMNYSVFTHTYPDELHYPYLYRYPDELQGLSSTTLSSQCIPVDLVHLPVAVTVNQSCERTYRNNLACLIMLIATYITSFTKFPIYVAASFHF